MKNIFSTKIVRLLFGMIVSLLFIFIAFKNMNLSHILNLIRQSNSQYLALSGLAILSCYLIRSLRWKILFDSENDKVALIEYFKAICVALMVNSLMFFRTMDIAQVLFFSHTTNKSRSLVLSSIVLKRFLDLLAVFAMISFSSIFILFPEGISRWVVYILIVLIILLFFMIYLFKKNIFCLIESFIKAENLRKRYKNFVDNFCSGLDHIKDKKRVLLAVLLTVILWAGYNLSLFYCMQAFNIKISYFNTIVVTGITSLNTIVSFFVASIGPFEVFNIYALKLFGIEKSIALSYALVFHFMSWLIVSIFGLFFLLRSGLTFQKLRDVAK